MRVSARALSTEDAGPRGLLQELIDYTLSVVGACAWVDDILPKALPLSKEPKQFSEAHKQALVKGQLERRKRERGQVAEARERRGLCKKV